MSYPPQGYGQGYGPPPGHGYGPPPGYGYGPPPGYGAGPGPGWGAPPPPSGPVPKPASIKNAVTCMWVGAALSVVSAAITVLQRDEAREVFDDQLRSQGNQEAAELFDADSFVTLVVVGAVLSATIGLVLWITHALAVGKGQNWARITGSILYAITVFGSLASLAQPAPALNRVAALVQLLVATGATAFMWLRPSTQYVEAVERAKRGW